MDLYLQIPITLSVMNAKQKAKHSQDIRSILKFTFSLIKSLIANIFVTNQFWISGIDSTPGWRLGTGKNASPYINEMLCSNSE
jgi:hypothetical protein